MRLALARVEGALVLGAYRVVDVERPIVHVFGPDYLAVIGQYRRVIDSCDARVMDRIVQKALIVLLLHILELRTRIMRPVA